MAILARIKAAVRSFFDNPMNWSLMASNSRPPTLAGVSLDEETALTHLPILAAVTRIATDMSLLDLTIEQETNDGEYRPARDSSLWPILTYSTDGVITTGSWVQASIGHLLTWGNAYSEIEFSVGGDVLGFHLLKPSRVTPDIVNGKLIYRYHDPEGGNPLIPAWKMLHFAGFSPDGIKGYSPIAMARETLAIGRAADLWGAAWFGNASRPSGILKHPGVLGDTAKKNLKESFDRLQGGPTNVGRIIVAEEGMEWTSLTVPPNDAQFLETRKFSVEDSARLYGMHPSKIGGPVEGGNLEERNEDYKQSVLLGWCKVIERQVEFKCTTPRQQLRVRFGFESLLRPNAAARANYISILVDRGIISPNIGARREGFPSYKGGDVYYRPMNMATVDPNTGILTVPQPSPQPTVATPGAPSFSATDPNKDQQQGLA